ncbi:MAG: (E)-4-hydroxy-3-methylbut-2-enyl-diphosphate synthase, partial [Luteibaculum sp.]
MESVVNKTSYCSSLNEYQRIKTTEVKVGEIGIGGNNPIRVQSMTTTDTMDTEASIAQSVRMIEAGCELVRITAPSKKEAENLANIKAGIRKLGYQTPLVADIHFTPNAAEIAARIVEKVRINPGNFVDKKKFEHIEYTDESYQQELQRIEEKFIPLIKICKEHGTAMRIGTNHGSLSDRILSRFGDTPEGMVESAMEFLRIAQREDFHQIVLSMKASNTLVMVQAYRLLVSTMHAEGMHYPLHLGVTEAGDGEDGRIKSAVGIGALLEDGIGDTIRVSLTEEPEAEIPVAQKLVAPFEKDFKAPKIPDIQEVYKINPYAYQKIPSQEVGNIGGSQAPVVLVNLSGRKEITPATLFPLGYQYSVPLDKWNIQPMAVDIVDVGKNRIDFEIPGTLQILQDAAICQDKERVFPVLPWREREQYPTSHKRQVFLRISDEEVFENRGSFKDLKSNVVLILNSASESSKALRAAYLFLRAETQQPIIISLGDEREDKENIQLQAASRAGLLLIDGMGEGISIHAENLSAKESMQTCFGILQATRTRISKTEYISCPSCGRTLF